MCFSASASFSTATLLLAAALYARWVARTRFEKWLSLTPALFSMQQAIEGMIWLLYPTAQWDILKYLLGYSYLLFSLTVWPLWFSMLLWNFEPRATRRKIIGVFAGLGIVTSALSIVWTLIHGIEPQAECSHIVYNLSMPDSGFYAFLLVYCLSTLGPLFCTSIKGLRIFGFGVAISLAAAFIMYYEAMLSTWCFFAALMSLIIIYLIKTHQTKSAHL